MIEIILNLLYKYKALNIKIIECALSYTDTVIIVNGTSKKHIENIASNLIKNLKKKTTIMTAGKKTNWIVLDLNTIIIHIMLKDTRLLYNLESLYAKNTKYV